MAVVFSRQSFSFTYSFAWTHVTDTLWAPSLLSSLGGSLHTVGAQWGCGRDIVTSWLSGKVITLRATLVHNWGQSWATAPDSAAGSSSPTKRPSWFMACEMSSVFHRPLLPVLMAISVYVAINVILISTDWRVLKITALPKLPLTL